MTILELIYALGDQITLGHGDFEVNTEGCDCIGDVGSLEVNETEKVVLLLRKDFAPLPERSPTTDRDRAIEQGINPELLP